jgi:hypothetical protein
MGAAHSDWMPITTVIVGAATVAANGVLAHLNLRRSRKLLAEYEQVAVLRQLLTKLAVDSLRRQNQPIWSYWAGALGTLRVEVTTGPKALEDDDE